MVKNINYFYATLTFCVFVSLGGCGGSSSEATLGAGEGGLSSASSVSAVSATE